MEDRPDVGATGPKLSSMGPSLIDRSFVYHLLLRDAPWCTSHGAQTQDGFLGAGLLYYTITYMLKARFAVCLGSGGGFVSRLMRQAQRDLGLSDARTVLVDGNLPQRGWGSPNWLDADSFFRNEYPDIEIVMQTTLQAAVGFDVIDYLHIDADHSYEGCHADVHAYWPHLKSGSVVTLHDTQWPGAGVNRVIDELRLRSDCEVLDFPIAAGTAVVRVR